MSRLLDSGAVQDALAGEDYLTVITEVRTAMTTDPVAAIQDPVINYWLGRRYRSLFVKEAAASDRAVKDASAQFKLGAFDDRSDQVKVDTRYLRRMDPDELAVPTYDFSAAATPIPGALVPATGVLGAFMSEIGLFT